MGFVGGARISKGRRKGAIGSANPTPGSTASMKPADPSKTRPTQELKVELKEWRFMHCTDLEHPSSLRQL